MALKCRKEILQRYKTIESLHVCKLLPECGQAQTLDVRVAGSFEIADIVIHHNRDWLHAVLLRVRQIVRPVLIGVAAHNA